MNNDAIDIFKALAAGKGIKFNEADAVEKFFSGQAVDRIDLQQIVAIAKMVCTIAGVVCPFVNQL